MVFTTIGIFVMPLIDIILKIEVIINILILPFNYVCPRIKRGKEQVPIGKWIHGKIEDWYEAVFNLNPYEIESFEK